MPLFQVVDKDSEEAEVIRKYVKNTHATTHNAYDLEVIDVRIFLPLFHPARSPRPLLSWVWLRKSGLCCFALF